MPKSMQPMTSPEHGSFTWAQKIYYRAKYGIKEEEVDGSGLSLSDSPSEIGVPGSNDRLQMLLPQNRETVDSRLSDGTLIHTGPDGSIILTSEIGWGLPCPGPSRLYLELDERYMCYWEISQATWVPEAPYWAV